MNPETRTPPGEGGAGEARTAAGTASSIPQTTPPDNTLNFLGALYADLPEGAPWFYLWTFPDQKTRWFTDPDTAGRWIAEHGDGRDVYCGIALADHQGTDTQRVLAEPDPKKPDGLLAGGLVAVVADVDIAGPGHTDRKRYPPNLDAALALVQALPIPPTYTVHSGGGLHLWWILREPWVFDGADEREEARTLLRGWGTTVQAAAKRMGYDVDPVHDLARVLRVPGTTNHKDPVTAKWSPDPNHRRPVTLLEANPDRRYNPGDFEEYFPEDFDPRESGAGKIALGDLTLPEGAEEELAGRFATALQQDRRLAATWARTRTDLRDPSPSGYDMALADRLAVKHRWTAAEVAWAVQHSRREHKGDKPLHATKLWRTVAKAMAAADEARARAQAQEQQVERQVDGSPDTQGTWNRTDVGNGQRLVARHGRDLRYCAPLGAWFLWDGKRWRPDTGNAVRELAKETARSIFAEAALFADEDKQKEVVKHAFASERDRALRAMLWCAESAPGIPVAQADMDADPWLLNVQNGTLDLRTGELREHRREDLLTSLCPVEYDPEAAWDHRSDLWAEFLQRVTGGDRGLQLFLQQVAGYALTGSTREEKLLFVYGPARSGKSTFLGALQATLGDDYSHTCDFEAFLKRKPTGGPKDDLANMAGKRLVVSIETDEGARLAEGLIKQLTGGDRVRARRLYANSFEFLPQFKLFLAANDRPKARDDDDALWERILEVPFPNTIPREECNPEVKEALCDPARSGAAILAWAVAGCLAWQRDGLQVPEVVELSTAAYRESMNPLLDFIGERCTLAPEAWVPSAALFDAYRTWAQEQGLRHTMTAKQVGEKLRGMGCEQRQQGTARTRGWIGIGLLSEREGEQ